VSKDLLGYFVLVLGDLLFSFILVVSFVFVLVYNDDLNNRLFGLVLTKVFLGCSLYL